MYISTIETESGSKYFDVFEVVAINYSGNRSVIRRYITRQAAQNDIEYFKEVYKKLYRFFYINEEIVWVE